MATFHGKDGTVSYNSSDVLNLVDWSITVNRDIVEADVMGTDAKATHAGHYGWTATVNVKGDDSTLKASASDAASSAELLITAKTGKTFTGNAWIESDSESASVSDTANGSITFRGDGALTPAVPV